MMQKRLDLGEAEALAEEHWEWLSEMLHRVYMDAMVHGYKHGWDKRDTELQELGEKNDE